MSKAFSTGPSNLFTDTFKSMFQNPTGSTQAGSGQQLYWSGANPDDLKVALYTDLAGSGSLAQADYYSTGNAYAAANAGTGLFGTGSHEVTDGGGTIAYSQMQIPSANRSLVLVSSGTPPGLYFVCSSNISWPSGTYAQGTNDSTLSSVYGATLYNNTTTSKRVFAMYSFGQVYTITQGQLTIIWPTVNSQAGSVFSINLTPN